MIMIFLFSVTSNFSVVLFKWRKYLIISWFITEIIKFFVYYFFRISYNWNTCNTCFSDFIRVFLLMFLTGSQSRPALPAQRWFPSRPAWSPGKQECLESFKLKPFWALNKTQIWQQLLFWILVLVVTLSNLPPLIIPAPLWVVSVSCHKN